MAFLVLNDKLKKLQVVLGGAVSSTELPITVAYRSDGAPGDSPESVDAITTGGTAVDVLGPAPSGRRYECCGLSIHNADSATATVTVREYVNASTTRIIAKVALLTGEHLYYSESRGFYAVDVNGAQKTTAATEASTADSKAESAATRASTALSAATSLDTATDTAFSTGDSATLSAATSLATRDSTAASTALSTASSAGLAASSVQSNDTRQSTDQSTMRSLLNSGGQAGF